MTAALEPQVRAPELAAPVQAAQVQDSAQVQAV